MADLAPRHRKMVDDYLTEYDDRFDKWTYEDVGHYYFGWTEAVKLLWPDAESFMGEDPMATEYVCRTLAIEKIFRRRSATAVKERE